MESLHGFVTWTKVTLVFIYFLEVQRPGGFRVDLKYFWRFSWSPWNLEKVTGLLKWRLAKVTYYNGFEVVGDCLFESVSTTTLAKTPISSNS